MTNLKSFDEGGLHSKIEESTEYLQQFRGLETFETMADQDAALDAIDTALSAALELSQRGHTTPEQDMALYEYFKAQGLID